MPGLALPDASRDAGAPPWRLVVALMLIYTYAFVDRVVLALLVDPIRRDLHATDFQMSLLMGLAFAACYAVVSLPAGHLADRVNRRRLIAAASIGWAVMTMVCGTARTMSQLFAGRMGVGLMEALVTPAAYSLIRDAVPARSRGLAFSIYALAPILGSAVSLAGGGFLLRAAVGGAFAGVPLLGHLPPWGATLVIVGMCGLPLSLLLLTFREPAREHPTQAGLVRGLGEACRYIGANGGLYAPLLIFAGVGAMMSFSYSAWFPTALARRFALAPQQVGPTLGSIALLSGTAGLVFGGWAMNRLTRRGGSVISYGIVAVCGTALGVGAACVAPVPARAFMFAAVGIFFLGISNPAGATTLSQATPARMVGRISAVYLLVQTLAGQTLGPLSVALASRSVFGGEVGIAPALALVQAGCAAVAVVCGALVVRMMRRQPAHEAV